MMLFWLDFLYLDGYDTLYDKYHDHSKVTRTQHEWIADNRKEFFQDMVHQHKFKKAYLYRKAYKCNDWDTMLEMMAEEWEVDDEVLMSNYKL